MPRFEANWESLKQYEIPQWYQDAKFGIFIHWGVYAVPAFGSEWYPRNMYVKDSKEFKHHLETYGPHDKFGYKDFIPLFTAEHFDANEWAALFAEAGAKFVMPVAEHHDGFPLYETAFNRWNAKEMGPKRDLIGELANAFRERGIVFTASTHRAEHWWFMNGGREFPSDVQGEQYADFYGPAQPKEIQPSDEYLEDWLARTCELVDKYQPQVVWFDWWIEEPAFEPYLQRFAAYYYNRGEEWGKGVAINYKHKAFPEGTAVYDIERGQLAGIREPFWQTDTAVAKNSWGYTEGNEYKTAASVIHDLVDIVSKNGALLLNIGPRADGIIPDGDVQILKAIGAWLKVNGEAIYGTRPWHTFGEGPTEVIEGEFNDTKREGFTPRDIRFTTKGDKLFAMCLGIPTEPILIQALAGKTVNSVRVLGGGLATFRNDEGGLVIAPPDAPCEHALTFEISLA